MLACLRRSLVSFVSLAYLSAIDQPIANYTQRYCTHSHHTVRFWDPSPDCKQLPICPQRKDSLTLAYVQVWLPGFTREGLIALTCAGAPYSIAGEGDLCALFRCVSCRYLFHPTSPDPKQRGSIGRVFVSHRVRYHSL